LSEQLRRAYHKTHCAAKGKHPIRRSPPHTNPAVSGNPKGIQPAFHPLVAPVVHAHSLGHLFEQFDPELFLPKTPTPPQRLPFPRLVRSPPLFYHALELLAPGAARLSGTSFWIDSRCKGRNLNMGIAGRDV
jgi:hypothetical protein